MTFPQANQPQYVLLCFAFGYAFGATTFIFDLFNQIIKNGRLSQLVSGIRLILLALFFTVAKNHYEMGEIRLFMPTFTLVGYCVYLKTIGKIIAKLCKKLYNTLYKGILRRIKSSNDARKTQQNSRSGNGIGSFAFMHIVKRNGLSNGNHKRQKSQDGCA